jgi:PAS domain S-box-containing protein
MTMSDMSSVPPRIAVPPLIPPAPLTSPDVAAAVFDALADAVVVYDRDGRIVGSNPAAVKLFSLTQPGGIAALTVPVAERALGAELRTLQGKSLLPQDWPALRVLRGETLQGAQTVDIVTHTLDGSELVLNVSGAPLLDAAGQVAGAVCVSRDITERVRLARDLAARAAEIESIFATQTEAIVFADRTGRIIRMNEAQQELCALAGVDPEARFIQSWAKTVAQFDALGQPIVREQRPFYRALEGETVVGEQAVELHQRSSKGDELILRVSGAPVRDSQGSILGAVMRTEDVTRRRLLERELEERASQIEGIFDALTDGIILVGADGRIVRMNDAQRQLVGYDADLDAPGCLYIDYAARRIPRDLADQQMPREQWPAARILRGERLIGADATQIRVRALDGRELILQLSGGPMRDASGHLQGVVVAVHDATERRQLEEQRNDILRVVSHDLLTPVTGIRLYLQMQERRLRKGQSPFQPGEEMLSSLNTNLLRMERLVTDLRELTRIESGALTLERRPCDLRALCQKEVEVQQQLTPGHQIRLEAPAGPIIADVDEQRIGQVVANLLSNALKYSASDRPVTLTVRAEEKAIHVAVVDKGPGIPEAEFEHIWDRYHRVEGIKAHGGIKSLGLGLYICRATILGHGGQIGVESTLGAGSKFWFTLPLVDMPVTSKQ